ncbi:MAG: winged helix-turn-helix domain-containing protein [Actinomycetota bacterium]|nr:winged helix-turn-helix domain-containing protein [Actinomycetota bacterium]
MQREPAASTARQPQRRLALIEPALEHQQASVEVVAEAWQLQGLVETELLGGELDLAGLEVPIHERPQGAPGATPPGSGFCSLANCKTPAVYRFNDIEIDPACREIRRGGVAVHLEPQAFDLLVLLIEHRDRVLAKTDLLDGVWGHRFLSDANLTTRVKEARRAVGDDGASQHTIHNVRGRGYRFVARLADDGPAQLAGPLALIGREEDYARVTAALRAQPLVTLLGPGGAGKTALARAMLSNALLDDVDGGHFVDLSALEPGADVLPAVALALSVSLDAARPATAVSAIARLDALVVFDNCEHVVDSAAELIERLLAVPDRVVRILATSRSRLGVGGEWIHEVAPLDPASALVLFAQRASAARHDWVLDGNDRERLDAMLARLDRLPLTIEMAAARLGSMTFADIVDSLDAGAPVLQVSHRSSGHRHRNLDSLVNWSVGLLPDDRRQVFEDCCVFAGAVTVDDAAVVLGTGLTTVVQLADLAERSLLAADLTATSARYRLLQTVRSPLTARFEASGRASEMRARHARHFASVAADADRRIRCTDEHAGRHRLEGIVPELRAAQRWAQINDPEIADALCTSLHLFTYSSFWNEPEEWARALLAADPLVPAPGAHLLVAGAEANRGELDRAMAHARTASTSPDRRVRAAAWEIMADVAIYSGDYAGTVSAADELRELAAAFEDPHLDAIGVVDHALAEAFLGDPHLGLELIERFDASQCSPSDRGWLSYTRGELLSALADPAAPDAYVSAIELAATVGNYFVASVARMSLATELSRAGERDKALDAYAECLRGYLRHGNLVHALTALRDVVEPLHDSGDTMTAVQLAAATFGDTRRVSYGAQAERLPAVIERLRRSVDDDDSFEQWWATGATLGMYDAVRLAAAALDRRHAPAPD